MFKRSLVICLIIIFLITPSNACYPPNLYEDITKKALLLMPRTFRNVLKVYYDDLITGAAESSSLLNSEDHLLYEDGSYGKATFRIKQLSDKIVYDIYHHVPFHIIAREFGYIVHYVTDLNNPFHTAEKDSVAVQCEKEFSSFMTNYLDKFPFVFYGYSSKSLEKNDIEEFSQSIVDRSSKLRKVLLKTMHNGKAVASARKFDEKSLVFGVAAVSYQHSISNTAQLWLHIWKNAHGDTRLE
ncbi:MAG: hypothetical protein A2Y62_15870 [Candidatus Fischerbacteria bacterium RBG_13_37_8]|uniref:Phospholipase C/D domain-containing protein n=1 Tax=Candidatus Fischerbacteria bacterium RBG_13_37_8 TaxID=1817863 RepID=A0A1F5VSU6_9BACT|nr:MAG: hypothetical protein A2Y62_15870 [Candidatus Fischerbacteria bacterium RBG_13_37_8]